MKAKSHLSIRRYARLCLALIFLLLFGACSRLDLAPSRGMRHAERYLSADTALLVQVPNVAQTRERWRQSATGKAWSDPAAEYWLATQFQPALDDLLERAGLAELPQALDLIEGQALLALELTSSRAAKPRAFPGGLPLPDGDLILAADFGKNAARARELIEKTVHDRQPWTARHEIALHAEPTTTGWNVCSTWMDDTWVIATSTDSLQALISRRFGTLSPSGARVSPQPLAKSPAWRAAAAHRSTKADAMLYVDAARLYDAVSGTLERHLTENGKAKQWVKIKALMEWVGFHTPAQIVMTTEIRDAGFYSRDAVTLRGEPDGLMFLTDGSKPLQTPEWMGRELTDFTAMRIRSPLELKQSLVRMIETTSPESSELIEKAETWITEKIGTNIDGLLSGLGSEIAMVTPASETSMFSMTLLWEIRDHNQLKQTLADIRRATKCEIQHFSYMGYPYNSQKPAALPITFYTAVIDGFLMVSTTDGWLKSHIDRGKWKSTLPPKEKENLVAAKSLLPILEAPFAPAPKNMTVVSRSYSDPAPILNQISLYLPMLPAMMSIQSLAMGGATLPSWFTSSIPPLQPFAKECFPSVSRSTQNNRLIVGETYSAFDPLYTPLTASLFVMAHYYFTEEK